MKAVKIIKLLCLFIVLTFLISLFVTVLSSVMQSHYKGLIDELADNAKLLEKKAFWAKTSDFPAIFYISVFGSAIITGAVGIIKALKNKRG